VGLFCRGFGGVEFALGASLVRVSLTLRILYTPDHRTHQRDLAVQGRDTQLLRFVRHHCGDSAERAGSHPHLLSATPSGRTNSQGRFYLCKNGTTKPAREANVKSAIELHQATASA
jgi:hypothetical protein